MASGSESLSSTLRGGHDYVYDYVCSQCATSDIEKEAVGYCSDCTDYLCAECFRYHLTPRPCRDHKLLDEKHMPKRPGCDVCKLDNKVRDAAGYCVTCTDYLCSECIKYHLRPKLMRHHEILDTTHMPLKKPSRDDNQKKPSKDDNQKKPSKDDNQKKPSKDDTQARPPSPAAAAPSLKTPSTPQHVTPTLPSHDARATRAHAQQLQQHQQSSEARKSRAVQDQDISITGQHKNKPWISGCVAVPANRLVLVDSRNSTIIMLAAAGNTAQTQLAFTTGPFDITMVSSSQLAVTCPSAETITFVKLGDRLQVDHKVKVKGYCRGIACINDTLVVSYCDPAKVEILSLSGKVLQTVVTKDQGKHLFTYPLYVAVSLDHASIYISDWSRHTVTRLSLAGQVLATFQDDKLVKSPHGLAVDKAGSVYVCGAASSNVVQLAPDLTQPLQLLQQSDGVRVPCSVCYCQATDKLYVGMDCSDVVKVFQLK